MTAILGISAFYHDAAAALCIDGQLVAAAQEERFTRRKHEAAFPEQAVAYCLRHAGIRPEELDYVGYYEKPLRKFERLIENYLAFVPQGYVSFRHALPGWLDEKLPIKRELRQRLPGYQKRIVFLEHHQSHAASAFFPSPFDEAAVLTLDGVGEWSTTCVGHGRGNQLELLQELRYPHSLGLLYSAFTSYLGFRVNSGEYKVMGLAPYGQPKYKAQILEHLVELKQDGSLRMDMSYFRYCQGVTMTSPKFHRLFGGPARKPESPLGEREMDLAASIQAVTEEAMLRMAQRAHALTASKRLVMAGGVALNCVGNSRILREGPFEELWIQPAAGDAGAALGVTQFIWHSLLERPRVAQASDSQAGSFLGPEFNDQQIRECLDQHAAVYQTCDGSDQLCAETAQLIDAQKVVGWFQGRMEFGPRALGARSILADARNADMQSILNLKIKFRESFRPFAPIVLRECVADYFETPTRFESPYMLLVANVRSDRISKSDDGLSMRSNIPAVTHVDRSARIQTVDDERHPLLHELLSSFHQLTGSAVMINTSFNVRGEPIVCTPSDAYRCFMMTDMDALAIGHHILRKSEQPELAAVEARRRYLSSFGSD
jgi:carbamoyltransferase